MTANEPTGPIISYHADLPGFTVNSMKFGNHWHVKATRTGDRPITGVGRTYEDALAAVKRRYNELDGWPLKPIWVDQLRVPPNSASWPVDHGRLDPHRGGEIVVPHAGLWQLNHDGSLTCLEPEQRVPPAACKLAGQPTGFVFDPMQDLDRAIERARKIRRETFAAAGRWIADRWLGLVVSWTLEHERLDGDDSMNGTITIRLEMYVNAPGGSSWIEMTYPLQDIPELNDASSVDVLQAIHRAGLRCREDIYVVGMVNKADE